VSKPYKRYQPTWIGGEDTGEPHQRASADRYEALKAFVDQYRRPFSVFDLGCNMGYFVFRLASDFPDATVIGADDKSELPGIAQANGLPNAVILKRRFSSTDLARLAECEAFDVVLALNVLHHMADWKEAAGALLRLGQHVILETPGPGDYRAANTPRHARVRSWAEAQSDYEMMRTHSHVSEGAQRIMYHLPGWRGKRLAAQTIDAAKRAAPAMRDAVVSADFERSRVWFSRGEERDFVPGMNLWNWRLLSGCWPKDAAERVKAAVEAEEAAGRWLDDLRPWNFILSGAECVPIDRRNKTWRTEPELEGLSKCLSMLASGTGK